MRRPLIALELASLFQLVLLVTHQDFHPLLEAPLNLPGVRLRLFPSGVAYLSQIANNILAEQLPRINIPDVEHRLPGDQGGNLHITDQDLKIRRAEIQDVSTSAPNRIMWIMKNLDLGFIGDLSGAVNIVVPFNLTGQAEIERAPNGSAHISTISCHSTIRAVEVINHNGGLFGLAVTVFKLAEVQTRSPLSEAIETNAIRATKLTSAVGGANIDNRLGSTLREDPFCGTNMVDLACAGEISYKGLGGTPFGPPPIAWLRSQSDTHMLMLQISDYLPNSLFYHAH
ncbi:hypothetical protein OSTOST_10905, partial [Ostertagia ostertagi]